MLKRTVTYKNFDGEEVTENLYFHMTKVELVEAEAESGGRISESFKALQENQNALDFMLALKTLIKISYGIKRPDGKFVKRWDGQDVFDEFSASEAYSAFVWGMMQDANEMAAFFNGVITPDMVAEVESKTTVVEVPKEEQLPLPAPKDVKDMTKEELLEHFKNHPSQQ